MKVKVKEEVKKVMSNVLGLSVAEIADDTSPLTIEGWDSLKHITLILALEEVSGIEFDEQQIPEMTSFGAIMEAIQIKVKPE